MKNTLKNKGSTYVVVSKFIYYLLAVIIVSYALITFVGTGFSFVQSQAVTPTYLEEDVLLAQLVNVCFVYEDSRGKEVGNILDLKKITTEQLDDCTFHSIELSLTSIDSEFDTVFLSIGTPRTDYETIRYVLVQTENGLEPAHLKVKL